MGHLTLAGISYSLPDGRPLLADVSFRVGAGVTALIGGNGTGKTTLLRIAAGELDPEDGAVTRSGSVAVMPQFIGSVRDGTDVRDLLISVSPAGIVSAAAALDAAELAMMGMPDPVDAGPNRAAGNGAATNSEAFEMAYAQALADSGDAGGYDWEPVTTWRVSSPWGWATTGSSFAP